MLRLTEVALFLAPAALLALWWVFGRRLAPLAWPAVAVAAVLAVVLAVFGLHQGLSRDTAYVPARLEGGRIVDGHGR